MSMPEVLKSIQKEINITLDYQETFDRMVVRAFSCTLELFLAILIILGYLISISTRIVPALIIAIVIAVGMIIGTWCSIRVTNEASREMEEHGRVIMDENLSDINLKITNIHNFFDVAQKYNSIRHSVFIMNALSLIYVTCIFISMITLVIMSH